MLQTLSRQAVVSSTLLDRADPYLVPPAAIGGTALELLKDAERAIASDNPAAREYVSRLLAFLDTTRDAIAIIPDRPAARAPAVPAKSGLAAWQVRRIVGFIDDHIDGPLAVATLADLVRLSPSHFCKAFKRAFEVCPHAYVMRRRIDHAQAAMISSEEPLSQIALSHGFSDQAHFCRVFRKIIGQSPRQWRSAHQRGV